MTYPLQLRIGLVAISLMSWLTVSAQNQPATKKVTSSATADAIYGNIEFAMPKVVEPSFPAYSVSITEFGAKGDGTTLNTKAIAAAIEQVAKKGGGKVIIPRGIWITGPIVLKSNINLHAEAGALVMFSKNFDDYPLIETSFEGLNTVRCLSPISGKNLQNIAITGEGVFDGSGDAWRPVKKAKLTDAQWKKLIASGGVLNEAKNTWYPSDKSLKGALLSDEQNNVKKQNSLDDYAPYKDFLRPVMLSLVSCKKVVISGLTFQNSPAWCLHPLMCEDITLKSLTVKNPWYSQNGDGLDLESCKNALVYKCNFDVGDDAICFKSGKDADGRKRGIPTENAIVKECVVYHGHGGFVVGSEMSGGIKNIHVSACTFIGTDVGLRFKSTRGRGGVVENIYVSNIDMVNIPAEPILFDLFYSNGSPIPEADEKPVDKEKQAATVVAVTEETPQFKNISIKNVVCKGAGRAIFLQGLPEMSLKNIRLENITIDAKKGLECIDANGIQLVNVLIRSEKGPAMYFKNSQNVLVDRFKYTIDGKMAVKVEGAKSENIHLKKADFSTASESVVLESNVKKEAVKID